ncbi:hypothetical protein HDR58_10850, partial [bacterium]|nr:hypothetical protein [bacterium]
MLVTANGVVTRLNAGSISCQGRPATGVRAQNLLENDTVCSVNKIVNPDEDDVTIKMTSTESISETAPAEDIQQTSLLDENNEK